ncbi:hypothetical protein M8C21_029736 [Ambrosia artemisiifolia]|uniref:Uncharacterized protein n=1 Tax=Ambrosia artemisiifolia TaxID=4212 RepID=A0AAD5C753_AMBAR|nr:hypothetical protein M8C21_029736 [Ambrosia artemisiifolia]
MKETRVDESKGDTVTSQSLVLDIEKFKGDFSYDALFAKVVNELLPSFIEDEAEAGEGMINISTTDTFSSGRSAKGLLSPLFPEVDTLLLIFKDSCSQLAELRKQVDTDRLYTLLHKFITLTYSVFV